MIFNLGKDYVRTRDGNYIEVDMVDVVGKCIKDAEVGKTQSGKVYAQATIVAETHRDGTGKFVRLKAWSGSTDYDSIATLNKGQMIRLVGYFTTREYNEKTYEDFNIVWVSSALNLFPTQPKTAKASAKSNDFQVLSNDADLPF